MNVGSVLCGFLLGILVESLFYFEWFVILFALLLTTIFCSLWWLKRIRTYLLVCLCLLGVCLGMVRTILVPTSLPEEFVPLLNTEVTLVGKVIADPDIRELTNRVTLEVEKGGVQTKVLAVVPLFPEVKYGEQIQVSGVFTLPEPFDTDGGRVFRYDQYLAKDAVFAIVEEASVEILEPRSGIFTHMRGWFSDIKFGGIQALENALPEPHASLAAGLVLGGKQGLGEDLLDDFINSGLIHIVVLSGYNVMIVAEAVLRLFGFLSKRWAATAAAIVISMFVLAAGAGAASIRAGVMAGIALFGRATGRTYDAARALLAAGVLMLLVNPLLLVYDPGFQLSFVATLGLIFGAPLVEKKLLFIQHTFLRDIVASTLAAQIFVLPLLLYQNGLFSAIALPANILVLPIVPLTMAASTVAGMVGSVLPGLAPLVGLPAYAFLSYIIGVVELTASLPFAVTILPAFPFVFVVLSYALLGWYVLRQPVQETVSPARSS